MIAAALLVAAVMEAAALVAVGDAHYGRRAEGAVGARAQPAEVDQALDSYRAALAADPGSNLARAGLIRAVFFRTSFCNSPNDVRRRLLREARDVADEGLRRLDADLGDVKGGARLEALRRVDHAAALHFWAAVAWGQWGLANGKLASVRQGVARRVRDLGQAVVDLDPAYEQGGGYRILGRLHDQCPRIPFLTGWVSHDRSLQYLRAALALDPASTVDQVFLAEAILAHDGARRAEAMRLLAACARAVPRPGLLVEDAFYIDRARQLLARPR
jgi:tetratricopeptide (TPR) repeat protein